VVGYIKEKAYAQKEALEVWKRYRPYMQGTPYIRQACGGGWRSVWEEEQMTQPVQVEKSAWQVAWEDIKGRADGCNLPDCFVCEENEKLFKIIEARLERREP